MSNESMTLGEICNALRVVWGEYVAGGFNTPPFLPHPNWLYPSDSHLRGDCLFLYSHNSASLPTRLANREPGPRAGVMVRKSGQV